MKFSFALFASLTVAVTASDSILRGNLPRALIVNGDNAGGSYESYVQFGDNACGGVLIEDNIVLTSATCVNGGAPSTVYIAAQQRCCTDDNDLNGIRYDVECAVVHPDYEAGSVQNDIALIKMTERCRTDPANLGNDQCDDFDRDPFFAVGLGRDETDEFPERLQEASMELVAEATCLGIFNVPEEDDDVLAPNLHVCVNHDTDDEDQTNDRGYCDGDGGTPLYEDDGGGGNRVLGIATPVNGTCGDPDIPDVYSNVCFYRDWIRNTIDDFEDDAIADEVVCNRGVSSGGGGCCDAIRAAVASAYASLTSFFGR